MTVFAEKTLNKVALCLIQTGFFLIRKKIMAIWRWLVAAV
jgi:hypothetical protein